MKWFSFVVKYLFSSPIAQYNDEMTYRVSIFTPFESECYSYHFSSKLNTTQEAPPANSLIIFFFLILFFYFLHFFYFFGELISILSDE